MIAVSPRAVIFCPACADSQRSVQAFTVRWSLVVFALALAGCGGGGGSRVAPPLAATNAAPPEPATNVPSVNDEQRVAGLLAASQRSDGAIPSTSTSVNPYFANIAAAGAAHAGLELPLVRSYIAWYITRSRDANPWGIAGAITDYTIAADGRLQSTQSADSVDSYAGTFLTLVAAAWRNGDATTRAYVQRIRADVNRIASAIDAVSDGDGLTWTLPTYHMKYVMDQSEVYAGLLDLAVVRDEAYGDAPGAQAAAAHAARIQAAIVNAFWDDARGTFAVALDAGGNATLPDASVWYDQMTQLAPILHGVVDPSSPIAVGVYGRFNAAFPAWVSLVKPDDYPWASTAFVALQMNDATRAAAYRAAADARYGPAYAYPWYCAETGWYLRALDGLSAPQTIAAI
jgi:hypothetical protein